MYIDSSYYDSSKYSTFSTFHPYPVSNEQPRTTLTRTNDERKRSFYLQKKTVCHLPLQTTTNKLRTNYEQPTNKQNIL